MQVQRLPPERLDQELAKVDERRDPPVPVWAWLTLDSAGVAGELYGWATNPNGSGDGLRGLVVAPREYAPGFWTTFCGWVRAEHVRKRDG